MSGINNICKIITWDSKTQKSSLHTVPGDRLIACIANEYFVIWQMQEGDENQNVLWHTDGGQLEEVGVIKDWTSNLNNTKDVFTFADNSMHLVDRQTGTRTVLPIQAVLRDDFSLCEISENKLIVYTQNATLAVWDMERNELVSETPLNLDNAVIHQVVDENYIVLRLNNRFQVWDIQHNKSILELNVPEEQLFCTMHHGNMFVLHENCLKIWNDQRQEFTLFQKNIEVHRVSFSDRHIFINSYKGIKIWDAHSLALLYHDDYASNSPIKFDEKKEALVIADHFELPVALIVPLYKAIDQLSDEQVQYVFDVLCYLDGIFCSDSEHIKEFASQKFNALPGLIQRLICNYFKEEADYNGDKWELVDGKKAIYQIIEIVAEPIVPEPVTQWMSSPVIVPPPLVIYKERPTDTYINTLCKVGAGAALALVGVFAYKWLTANNSNE